MTESRSECKDYIVSDVLCGADGGGGGGPCIVLQTDSSVSSGLTQVFLVFFSCDMDMIEEIFFSH